MKIAHVMPDLGVYTLKFLDFIGAKQYDWKDDHVFFLPQGDLLRGAHMPQSTQGSLPQGLEMKRFPLFGGDFLALCKWIFSGDARSFRQEIANFDKIFWHFLDLKALLYLHQTANVENFYWVIWGGDVHYKVNRDRGLVSWIRERIREKEIAKIKNVCVDGLGKDKLLNDFYGVSPKVHVTPYPNPIDFATLDKVKNNSFPKMRGDSRRKRLLLGNSASAPNRHVELLEGLAKNNVLESNFEIVCPLSYGDSSYGKFVAEKGNALFGSKFLPIWNFLSPQDYAELMFSVDVAIMGHKEVPGISTLLALLYLGKKVYLRSDVVAYKAWLEGMGVAMFDTLDVVFNKNEDLFAFSEEDSQANCAIIAKEFSSQRCFERWQRVFSS